MMFLVFPKNRRQIEKIFFPLTSAKKERPPLLVYKCPVCDHLTVIIIFARSVQK